MGSWSVDNKTEGGVLRMRVAGRMSIEEMREFVAAHKRAVDDFAGADYRVWCDLRDLHPLQPECSALFEQVRQYGLKHQNCRGSAVLTERKLS